MKRKEYEVRCIALLKKFPHAINVPQPPSMFTPFLVRAEVNKLLSLQVKFVVLLLFKYWWMIKSLYRVVKISNSLVICHKHLNTPASFILRMLNFLSLLFILVISWQIHKSNKINKPMNSFLYLYIRFIQDLCFVLSTNVSITEEFSDTLDIA